MRPVLRLAGLVLFLPTTPAPALAQQAKGSASASSSTEVETTKKGVKTRSTEAGVTTETEVTTDQASVKRQAGDTTTEATVSGTGATVTHQDGDSKTRADASAEGASVVHEDGKSVTRGELDAQGLRATREADCAKDPTNEICHESSGASVDESGVRFGFKKTSVQRVRRPGNRYSQLLVEAGGIYGEGDNLRMAGASAGVGLQGAIGTQLPGEKGGSFHGLGYRGLGHFSYVNTEIDTYTPGLMTTGETVTSSDSTSYDAAAVLGYQFLTYGNLDPKKLTQSGFGVFLGYQAGLFGTEGADPQFSHGPNLVISRPTYNAGTVATSSWFLSGIVLPLDSLFIAAVSLGYAGFGGGTAPKVKKAGESCQEHADCGGDLICSSATCQPPPTGPATTSPPSPPSNLPPSELPALDF